MQESGIYWAFPKTSCSDKIEITGLWSIWASNVPEDTPIDNTIFVLSNKSERSPFFKIFTFDKSEYKVSEKSVSAESGCLLIIRFRLCLDTES